MTWEMEPQSLSDPTCIESDPTGCPPNDEQQIPDDAITTPTRNLENRTGETAPNAMPEVRSSTFNSNAHKT
ncbi:hypothetical protein ACEPPN_014604 [Leptodophora sp. 'Broadleaf-Isolate-01']